MRATRPERTGGGHDLAERGEGAARIESPNDPEPLAADALRSSGGAWSDEAHPELETREDVLAYVRALRGGHGRGR
jgi:hypothetical protein